MTLLQWVALEGLDATGITSTGESAGGSAFLAVVIGTTFALLGLAFCQAATACALVELDRGKSIAPVTAYRVALRRTRPLLGAVALFVVVWVVLTSTAFLIPVAIWLAVRWCLVAPVIELEELGAIAALRRSTRLVRGRWFRIGSLVGLSAAIALVVGPLLGALLIFTTNLPLAFLNLVSGIVYAAALPFVGIVTAYAYLDARARVELAPEPAPKELPAEIELAT